MSNNLKQDEIRLLSGDSGIPVEVYHSKITKPSSDKFSFIPKNFTQLKKSVLSMTWNSSKKLIFVELEETIEYDVIHWMNYLVKENIASQTSPFVDVDTNNLDIEFHDINGHPTGNLHVKNVKMENHTVSFSKYGALRENITDGGMMHNIELSYQYSEFSKIPAPSQCVKPEEDLLEEWQKVELMPAK